MLNYLLQPLPFPPSPLASLGTVGSSLRGIGFMCLLWLFLCFPWAGAVCEVNVLRKKRRFPVAAQYFLLINHLLIDTFHVIIFVYRGQWM